MGIGTVSRFTLPTFRDNLKNLAASPLPRMGQMKLIRFQTASDLPRSSRYSFSFFRIFLILVGFANYSLVLAQKLRPNL